MTWVGKRIEVERGGIGEAERCKGCCGASGRNGGTLRALGGRRRTKQVNKPIQDMQN